MAGKEIYTEYLCSTFSAHGRRSYFFSASPLFGLSFSAYDNFAMSVPTFAWRASDMGSAARVIWDLLNCLDSKRGVRQIHRQGLEYLRSDLLPTLRLIPRYLKDIERQRSHPCWEGWNSCLTMLKNAWGKFEDYLQSRRGLLAESARHQLAISVMPWTWDEVTGEISSLRKEIQGVLNDIDRLILWEISNKFGLVMPRLDAMFERIQGYGECVSTYRQDVQEVLCFIRTNEQDLESLKDLFKGNMAELAQRLADSQTETEAVNIQLQITSEKLDRLLAQLAEQRGNCASKIERNYLDQLRKEVRKQAASIQRLRRDVEDTLGTTAEVWQALNKLDVKKEIFQKASGAVNEVNEVLKKAVPVLEKLYDGLKQPSWGGDVKQMLRFLGRKQKLWVSRDESRVDDDDDDDAGDRRDPHAVGEAIPDLDSDGDNDLLPTIQEEELNQGTGSHEEEHHISYDSLDRRASETSSTASTSAPSLYPASTSSTSTSSSSISQLSPLPPSVTNPFNRQQLTPWIHSLLSPPPIPRKSSARRRSSRSNSFQRVVFDHPTPPLPTTRLTRIHPPSPTRSPPPPPPPPKSAAVATTLAQAHPPVHHQQQQRPTSAPATSPPWIQGYPSQIEALSPTRSRSSPPSPSPSSPAAQTPIRSLLIEMKTKVEVETEVEKEVEKEREREVDVEVEVEDKTEKEKEKERQRQAIKSLIAYLEHRYATATVAATATTIANRSESA